MLLTAASLLTACANPGSGPDGGPYDETPPRIVGMSPALGQTNEKAKKVTISFDEMIKVENAQDKIIVSPPQIEMPDIKTSGKRISVQLQDTLKPNTTYTIDFSDAIVDNNEGNPLGNFTYYFSTGAQLDTMEVAGRVLEAQNLEPIKGILVGLHSNLADSAFTALPFSRVARTDASGHFCIKGVAPGTYHIFALKDMDGDFKYSRGEMIAFSPEKVVPSSFADVRHDTLWADTVRIDTIRATPYTHYLPDNLVLLAFNETNTNRQFLKAKREPEYFRTFFTAPSKQAPIVRGLNFEAEGKLIEDRSLGNDTITYWLNDTTLIKQDTLTIAYTYECTNDSTYENFLRTDTLDLVPQFSYAKRQKFAQEDYEKWKKGLEKRHKRGDFSQEEPPAKPLAIKFSSSSSINPDENLHFTLPEPARRVDTTFFHLYTVKDSVYTEQRFRLEQDPGSLLNYTLRAEWRPGQKFVLNVDSAAIEGISGKVSNTHDAKIDIANEEKYGSLFLNIPDADSTGLVQLISSDEKVYKQVKVQNHRADFFYLKPADFYVRYIADRNQNGQWDPGSYATQQQAEEVYYYPDKFTIRANWDIEQTWQLKALPIDKQKPKAITKQKADATKQTPRSRNAERERQKRGN